MSPHSLNSNSVGTYGFWSSYLAGGDVIMAAEDIAPTEYELHAPVKAHLPHWTLLDDPCLEAGKRLEACTEKGGKKDLFGSPNLVV